jgi:hypothetical protein
MLWRASNYKYFLFLPPLWIPVFPEKKYSLAQSINPQFKGSEKVYYRADKNAN